jgi:hypothetical protein
MEIVLESTANGTGNFFHHKWREAETGCSEYICIFTPLVFERRIPQARSARVQAWRGRN